ncbi:MAG: hypothetical protein A3A33_03165 [Candidatus Yanofskybacteria bacterium RIFCSPLOWO2_01_FULL_49_25]|uniref:Uncharacterized protein n=1 Tax=Candidatus Yanofskybacteria bacterium RIFCSPLOWO2_01_FULL_49_25 TaxID=1802701 RepID=A0A1F8GVR8_9BACT|nr:MAG: hypothetical protein A3A33_03165 [Candidatus Yanofskybacteria bacterium RIFCSPLOWO2_01_FULL_49_25]
MVKPNRYILILLVVFAFALVVVRHYTPKPVDSIHYGTATVADERALVDALFKFIQKDRTALGVSPVYLDYALSEIAQYDSREQYKILGDVNGERLYRKLSVPGITFDERVQLTSIGIGSRGSGYVEYLATGISAESIYEAFVGHKDRVYHDAIMEDGLKKIGIGISARNGLLYVVIIKERVDRAELKNIISAKLKTEENYTPPGGYRAFRISAQTANGKSVENIGTYITNDRNENFMVQYVTKIADPYFANSAGGVDFESIRQHLISEHKTPVMIAAAAFTPDNKTIQGFALENGRSIGESAVNKDLNGLVVIENSKPRLRAVSEVTDWDSFILGLEKQKASLFQQTSYIRPGGVFSSSKSDAFELRFFVEGTLGGKPTNGIIDFSIPLTYAKAVGILQTMQGLVIEKAIGLDTGYMSEAYLYDDRGNAHVLFDDAVASSLPNNRGVVLKGGTDDIQNKLKKYRSMYTNVIVVYK